MVKKMNDEAKFAFEKINDNFYKRCDSPEGYSYKGNHDSIELTFNHKHVSISIRNEKLFVTVFMRFSHETIWFFNNLQKIEEGFDFFPKITTTDEFEWVEGWSTYYSFSSYDKVISDLEKFLGISFERG